jgi:predicted secreted protein
MRIAGFIVATLIAGALALAGLSIAAAEEGDLSGALPTDGGMALVGWGGGNAQTLAAAALDGGCRAESVWAADGGSFVGLVYGAPAFVNDTFLDRFPAELISARPLLLFCQQREEATERLGVLAGDVHDAIRDRDQDRIRDLSDAPLLSRTLDQDRLNLTQCWPAGATFDLLDSTVTVEGAQATVEARFQVDDPTGGQFEHTRTWVFRWETGTGWLLDELPACPWSASPTVSAIESAAATVTRAIRERDQDRLRDIADDPDRSQQRSMHQRQERERLVDELALCGPVGASLELIGADVAVVANTATVTARLRLYVGGDTTDAQQTWQFRSTAQQQWRLDDQLPNCPFAPPSITTLTAADAGSTVTLAVGDRLYVQLDGNPTTGYLWDVDGALPTVLEAVGQTLFQSESDLIGAPGTFTLRFEVIATGSGALRLIYHRPFETADPLDTFEVTVTVQ